MTEIQPGTGGRALAPSIAPGAVETTIHARFEAQVERFGDRLAVHDGDEEHSYAALNAAANRLAHDLLDRAGPGEQTAALLVDQGFPLATAMLGSLKAGRSFVPLDPGYPEQRLRAMLEDSGAETVISNDRPFALALRIAGALPVLNLDHLSRATAREGNPGLPIEPTRLAYILYTSGSTGRPKGVMQDHRSVVHNMLRHRALYGITESDRQTLLYPCSVYGGVRDTYNALLNGAGLYHYPLRSAGYGGLADWIERHQLSIYCSVATVFRYFARELQGRDLLPSLRLLKLGGEAPLRRDIELFKTVFCAHTIMFCGLGSTETGISRQFKIARDTPVEAAGAPLGYPVPDMDVLLLDEERRPVGLDTIGEIAVRSRYVTRGYRGRDELNARVLLPDPSDAQSRIFLTGDLGALDAHGCLVHKGRKDEQVKIRGNRVELPEVEAALADCQGIRDAVVVAQTNERGDAQLVAYTVPREQPGPEVGALRRALEQRLPVHMVPTLFVSLDAIPLTPNGKIDRRALPDPREQARAAGAEAARPRSELEGQLLAIMEQQLGRQGLGATDSFFDVGGDSLLAVQMVLEIERRLGRVLPLTGFYDAPTARGLAARLERLEHQPVDTAADELVALRAGGADPPLFCVAGRGGTVFSYRGLVERLGGERPVYGLQLPGLTGGDAPIAEVEALATELLRRVRTVNPDGPLLLLGYSFGGLVAYEMACQARAAGQPVPYLAMIDTFAPNCVTRRGAAARAAGHFKRFLRADAEGRRRYVSKALGTALAGLTGKRPARLDPVLVENEETPAGQGQITEALRRLMDANEDARNHYRPRPFDGRLHMFKTTARPAWRDFYDVDDDYGWTPYVPAGIVTYPIPGEHLEVFDPSHLAALSERVRASLSA